MLWKSQIRLKQKIGLTVLFGAGVFVMIAGVIRCVIILSNPVAGASQAGNWAVRESFVAVVIGNLPMIYPVLHRGVRRFASSYGGSSGYNLSGSGGGAGGGGGSRHGMGTGGAGAGGGGGGRKSRTRGTSSAAAAGLVVGGGGGGGTVVLGGSVVRSGGAGGGMESVLLAAESRRRESFATDDSRGRIVEPGFEKGGGGTQRVVETDAHTEDGASTSERGMSFSHGFEERH